MSWNTSSVHQDYSSTGSYDSSSALAQEYNAAEEDSSSRVDDGEGWRQVVKDSPPKNAAEYEALVKKWSAAGFDVKAIDMDGKNFTNSNIAVKPKSASTNEATEKYEPSERIKTAKERVEKWESGALLDHNYNSQSEETGNGDATTQSHKEKYKLNLREKAAKGQLGKLK